jgi:hypothetical protein
MSDESITSKATDWAKKLLTVGVGTVFLTEEALRTLMADFKIPKEMIAGLLDSAKTARKEFIQGFSSEIFSKLSDKADPVALMTEFLKRNEVTFEVKVCVKEKDTKENAEDHN